MGKEMAENSSALRAVTRVLAPAAQGLRTATRPNKKYTAGTILVLVALAASNGTSVSGCLELREYASVVGRVPTAEWARVALRTCDAGVALRHLRASATRHLRTLRRRGEIPAQVVVAFDMHGIHRHGRAVPRWLVRARSDRGPARREKYMTAQCVTNGMWAAPGAVRVMPGDSVEVMFSTVYMRVRAVCARACVRPVLLMDRGHFTAGVLGRLAWHRVRWPVPCPNSRRVSAALRDFTAGRRGAVSKMRISDGRGREAPYTMIIRKRKKRKGRGPEGAHIAFATNMPSADPDEPCPRRWGIENGYKLLKQTRMRTPGRDENVRIFCFVASLMVHNA